MGVKDSAEMAKERGPWMSGTWSHNQVEIKLDDDSEHGPYRLCVPPSLWDRYRTFFNSPFFVDIYNDYNPISSGSYHTN